MRRADGQPVTVLVVDDEPVLAEMVSMALRYEGWNITTAGDGSSAIAAARRQRPDVVVLDVMLPDMSGLDVLHKLRSENPGLPVLLLTAKDAVEDRIAGLTAGGDDYVTKPFSIEEVVLRLRALLRRTGVTTVDSGAQLVVGDLVLDEDSHEVMRAGEPVSLTSTEFELLRFMMHNSKRVLSKAQILDRVWSYDFGGRSNIVELETRVRQFVADASHELRTPLAAIRGYTELTQRIGDDPEAVAHAMSRVASETERITRLVEDLLLLARLDSGRPLERGPVDMSRLAVDAVSDAHVAGPDHQWALDLPPEPVVIPGDAARLHQVVTNLLANARVHTGPGTIVTTRLSTGPTHVVLQVIDNGPGIPAALQSEVFERFARGDTSRSRQAGSTGLGLAIVSAVVKAHNGTITVSSSPGYTEFAVRLPLDGWQPLESSPR